MLSVLGLLSVVCEGMSPKWLEKHRHASNENRPRVRARECEGEGMTINEYLQKHKQIIHSDSYGFRKVTPGIECADGFSMSVQVSSCHYCKPREDDETEYTHVEVGYPSQDEELLLPFADEWEEDGVIQTSGVYGYVPVEVVDAIIEKHGGINHDRSF